MQGIVSSSVPAFCYSDSDFLGTNTASQRTKISPPLPPPRSINKGLCCCGASPSGFAQFRAHRVAENEVKVKLEAAKKRVVEEHKLPPYMRTQTYADTLSPTDAVNKYIAELLQLQVVCVCAEEGRQGSRMDVF